MLQINQQLKHLRWKIAQFVEKLWWKRYLSSKPVADYHKWKIDYWKDFLKRIDISIDPDSHILDAGCGPAGIFMICGHNNVTAIDPLLNHYSNLEHFVPANYPNVNFIQTDLESYRSETKYDYIFCLNVINHVRDISLSISNLISHLHDNGILILSTDIHRKKWLQSIFNALPGDILHPHQYTSAGYEKLIHEAGGRILTRHLLKEERIFSYQAFVINKDRS